MIATLINAAAVIIGSFIGFLLKKGLNQEIKAIVFVSAGLVTLVMGMKDALESTQIILMVLALVSGGILGTLLHIQEGIQGLGERIRRMVPALEGEGFGRAFLDASLIFCVGALTILGSLDAGLMDAGLGGSYDKLLLKSVLDGCMAIVLTASLGPGVGFSALIILFFQGGLTLGARFIEPLLSVELVRELGAVGGVMIMMIGLEILEIKKTKPGNFLPALLIIALLVHFSFLWENLDLSKLLGS